MRFILLAALTLTLISCEKEHDEVAPVFNAETALNKMYFSPHYNNAGQIIGTRFTIPLFDQVEKISLTKYGKTLDVKTNPVNNAYLYDTITNKFPQHDSVFTFTLIYKGETTTTDFKTP